MKAKHFIFLLLLLFLIIAGCGGGSGGDSGSSGGITNLGNSGGSGTISLAWDAPTTNSNGSPLTDLAGYRIYYGTSSGLYAQSVDVGKVTAYTLTGLTKGQTYFIAIAAYDISNNESGLSNEVSGAAK